MEYILKASIVTSIFYVCYILFLQKETFFQANRWFLLGGLLSSFLLPLVVIPIHIIKEAPVISQVFYATNNATPLSTTSIDYWALLLYLYIVGVIGFSIHLIIQLNALSRLLQKQPSQQQEHFKFLETTDSIAPFSFFKWIVFNPSQFSKQELHQILVHEKVHARQWHSIDLLISQITTVLFWFNPLIWLYKKALQQNLEFIADAETQKDIHCKKSYQYLLLKTGIQDQQLAFANHFYNSLIKKRIVMLHKHKSQKHNAWKFALVLPLTALFLMSFNTKEIVSYANNNEVTDTLESSNNLEMILITKNTSDSELASISKTYKEKGIYIKFKGVKRNSANEITKIAISAKTDSSKVSYTTDGDESIDPIQIKVEGQHVSIADSNEHDLFIEDEGTFGYVIHESKDHDDDSKHKKLHSKKGNVFVYSSSSSSDGNHKVIEQDDDKIIIKSGTTIKEVKKKHKDKDGNVFIIKETKEGDVITEEIHGDSDSHTWTKSDGETVEIIKSGKSDNMLFISSEDGKAPLYIVDGKEVSKDAFLPLDTDDIESVSVLKGDAAIKAYGKKAKHGAIIITTKK